MALFLCHPLRLTFRDLLRYFYFTENTRPEIEKTKISEEQKSKVQQVTVERLQQSHGWLIQVVSVFPVQSGATSEDKLKALIDLDAQQRKLCA